MSSPRVEVLLWARRIVAKKSAEPHMLLEIKADATLEQAQEAFHKIARTAHPDLHRTLPAEDLEVLTSAYAAVANAYQQFRHAGLQTTKLAHVKVPVAGGPNDPRTKRDSTIKLPGGGVIRSTGQPRPPPSITSTPTTAPLPIAPKAAPAAAAAIVPEPPPSAASLPAGQMNSKALIHFRKAELALRQGDGRTGVLHLKMAIAADPTAAYLRAALSEVEAELGKKP